MAKIEDFKLGLLKLRAEYQVKKKAVENWGLQQWLA